MAGRLFAHLLLTLLCSCKLAEPENYKNNIGVEYIVDSSKSVNLDKLPSNSALKMLDGDIVGYAGKLCGIDDEKLLENCEVYAQSTETGIITGYVAIKLTNAKLSLVSDANCYLAGDLFAYSEEGPVLITNNDENLEAKVYYSAWERASGDVLLSIPEDGSVPDGGAEFNNGIWNIIKKSDKLNIKQDKWNYCDRSKIIDEVFYRVISFDRLKPESN